MKNIGNFKSHICKSCTNYPKSQAQAIVKLCLNCEKKSTVLEDLVLMDYFSLFNLKLKFKLDSKAIDKEYRALQKIVHPDLIASLHDNEAIKEAESASAHISKSYETLKNEFERAKFILSCVDIDLDKFNLCEEELEEIMEMNLDIDSCDNIKTINILHDSILEKKNNIVNLINQKFEKAFIGIDSITDLVKHYSNPSSKLVFSEIAKLTNQLKFFSNALNQVEDKQELIRKISSNVHNKMI